MDPNYFFVNWERLMEVLGAIVVISFFLERALSMLFESRFYLRKFQGKSLKEVIATAIGIFICAYWKFDALSFVLPGEQTTIPGYIITGAIIAGGSKASVKLFKDILGVKSTAQAARDSGKPVDPAPDSSQTNPVAP